MLRTGIALLFAAATLLAQSPAGHWEGAIQTPGGDLQIQIDLASDAKDGWIGTMSVPAQMTKGLRLNNLTVKENSVSFTMKAPGDPHFSGTVNKEGKKLTGELVQGGATMPVDLTRTGDAKIEKPTVNPSVSKALEGTWEGALDANGKTLRLKLIVSNKDGNANGTLFSIDQGNAEIPVEKITETGSHVKLEIPVVSGGFEGDMKDGQIDGTWTQGMGSLPLKMTKAK